MRFLQWLLGFIAGVLEVIFPPRTTQPTAASRPTALIQLPTGGVLRPPVTIDYQLIDANATPVDLVVEYSRDAGVTFATARQYATGTAGTTALATSPAGVPHRFIWDAAADLGASAAGVIIRLIARHSLTSQPARTPAFDVRLPSAPRVQVPQPPSGVLRAPIRLQYTIDDADAEPARVEVEWSRSGGSWQRATEFVGAGSEGLNDLVTTTTGTSHIFDWDANADGAVPATDLRLRIRVFDVVSGNELVCGPFELRSGSPPRVTMGAPPAPAADGRVLVDYTLIDADAEPVSIAVSWSMDGGLVFQTATEGAGSAGTTNLATTASGASHRFVWSAASDLPLGRARGVMLRIEVSDGAARASADSAPFDVLTNSAPVVDILSPAGGATRAPVTVHYRIRDAESDAAALNAEFSSNDGASWHSASELAGSGSQGSTQLATSPAGVEHTFVWDAERDLASTTASGVRFRIAASDTVPGPYDDVRVDLTNAQSPPAIRLARTEIDPALAAVVVDYVLIDSESDPITIDARFSLDGGATFQPANERPHAGSDGVRDLTSSPDGVAHRFLWDALRDLPARDVAGVILRFSAADRDPGGVVTTAPLHVQLAAPPAVQLISPLGGATGAPVAIRYRLLHEYYAQLSIEASFSTDGLDFRPATRSTAAPSDGRSALSSSPEGAEHLYLWDAPADVGAGATGIFFRIQASDGQPGPSSTTGALNLVSSAAAPSIRQLDVQPDAARGRLAISFVLADPTSDAARIVVEYSLDGGNSFGPITAAPESNVHGPFTTSPAGEGHTVIWNYLADTGERAASGVIVSVTAMDAHGVDMASTSPFDISTQPRAVIQRITKRPNGEIAIEYTLHDPLARVLAVTAEWSADNVQFYEVFPAPSSPESTLGLAATPAGRAHQLTWVPDPTLATASQLYLRITPTVDGGGIAANNGPLNPASLPVAAAVVPNLPRATIDAPRGGAFGSPIELRYRLHYPQQDPCDVEVEFSADDGVSWLTATEALEDRSEGTVGLTSRTDGAPHVFFWDALVDLGDEARSDLRVRITPRATEEGIAAVSAPLALATPGRADIIILEPAAGAIAGFPVQLRYRLRTQDWEPADVAISYSIDGTSFQPATEATQHGSSGTAGLLTSSTGIEHTFAWDAAADLGGVTPTSATLRIQALNASGTSARTSAPFTPDSTRAGAPEVPDPYAGSTSAGGTATSAAEIEAVDFTRYRIRKIAGDAQTVAAGLFAAGPLQVEVRDGNNQIVTAALEWRVVEAANNAPIALDPRLHAVHVRALPGTTSSLPAEVEVRLKANPSVSERFSLTVEPAALHARGGYQLNYQLLDPARSYLLFLVYQYDIEITLGEGVMDPEHPAEFEITGDELLFAPARVSGTPGIVGFVPLPPPAGQTRHTAKLRVACTSDPAVAPIELNFTVEPAMNALRRVPAFAGGNAQLLALFLRPSAGFPGGRAQLGCPGEELAEKLNVELVDHTGQAYTQKAINNFEGCTVEPGWEPYRVSWLGPIGTEMSAPTSPFSGGNVHPNLGDAVTVRMPPMAGGRWPRGPFFIQATLSDWEPVDPARRQYNQYDGAGNVIGCTRYNILQWTGSSMPLLGCHIPVEMPRRAEALTWEVRRLGDYPAPWQMHRKLPYLAGDDGTGAPGAEMLLRPAESHSPFAAVENTPIGQRVHVTFRIPEGLSFDAGLAARAYFDPALTTWQDFTGAPTVVVDANRPHEAVVRIEASRPVFAVHLHRIRYHNLGALKGLAVPITARYRIVESCGGAPAHLAAPEQTLWTLVNLLVHPRDLGLAAASHGAIRLSSANDHHNVCNGNLFVEVPIVATDGVGENTDLSLCYNSREALFRSSLERMRIEGWPATLLEEFYGAAPFSAGWTHTYGMYLREHRLPDDQGALDFIIDLAGPDGNRILLKRTTAEAGDAVLGLGEYTPVEPSTMWQGSADAGHSLRLVKAQTSGVLSFTLRDYTNREWVFDSLGRLVEIADAPVRALAGRISPLTIVQGATGIRVTDSSGRVTRIHYTTPGLERIIDTPDGFRTVVQSLTGPLNYINVACDRNPTDAHALRGRAQQWSFTYDTTLALDGPWSFTALLGSVVDPTGTRNSYAWYGTQPFEGVPAETARRFWGRLGKMERGQPVVQRFSWRYRPVGTGNEQDVVYRDPADTEFVLTYRTGALAVVAQSYIPRDRNPTTHELLQTPNYAQVLAGAAMPVTRAEAKYEYHEGTKLLAWEDDLYGDRTSYGWQRAANSAHAWLLQRVTRPDTSVHEFEYDSDNRLEKSYSPVFGQRGDKFTQFAYDPLGRLREKTLPVLTIEGVDHTHKESWTYDPTTGLLHQHTDPSGVIWTFGYDAAMDPGGTRLPTARSVDVGGRTLTWETEYDRLGRVLSEFDPTHGGTTRQEYNRIGLLIRAEQPEIPTPRGLQKAEVRYYHDALGRLRAIVDSASGVEQLEYDRIGHLIARRHTNGAQTRFVRRPDGALLRRTEQGRGTTTYVYDEIGRLLRENPPTPDARDAARRSATHCTLMSYDDANRQVVQRRHAVSAPGAAVGALLQEQVTTLAGGRVHDLVTRIQPDGKPKKLIYSYDAWGNETSLQWHYDDALQRTITFLHDDWGRPVGERRVGGTTTDESSWTLDPAGRTIEHRSANVGAFDNEPDVIPRVGRVFDVLGRLTAIKNAGGAVVRQYEFHDYGNRNETVTGPRVAYQRELGTDPARGPGENAALVFVRRVDVNRRGLPVTYRYEDNLTGAHTEIVYDRAGRMVEERHPGDRRVVYEYDEAGRLTQVSSKFPERKPGIDWDTFDARNPDHIVTTVIDVRTVKYDASGAIAEEEDANYHRRRLRHDRLGRVYRVEKQDDDGWRLEEELTFDALGRVSRRELSGNRVQTFVYSQAGQAVEWSMRGPGSDQCWELTYDWEQQLRTFRQRRYIALRAGVLPERVRLEYNYDGLGRLQSRIYRTPDDKIAAQIAVGRTGNVVTRRNVTLRRADGSELQRTAVLLYDEEKRLRVIRGTMAQEHYYFAYNHAGLLKKITRPLWYSQGWHEGNETEFAHDVHGRLTEITEKAGLGAAVVARRTLHYETRAQEAWERPAAWDIAVKDMRAPDPTLVTGWTYRREFMRQLYPSNTPVPHLYTQDLIRNGDGQVAGSVTRAFLPGRRSLVDTRRTEPRFAEQSVVSHRVYNLNELASGASTTYRYATTTHTRRDQDDQVGQVEGVRDPASFHSGQPRFVQHNEFDAQHQIRESWFLQEGRAGNTLNELPAQYQDHQTFQHDAAGRLVSVEMLLQKRADPNPAEFEHSHAGGAGDSQLIRVVTYYGPDGEPFWRTVSYVDQDGAPRESSTLVVTDGATEIAEVESPSGRIRYYDTIPGLNARLSAHTFYGTGTRSERLYYRRDANGAPAFMTTGEGDVVVDYLAGSPDGQQDLFGEMDRWPTEFMAPDPDSFLPRADPWTRRQEFTRYYASIDPRLDLALGRMHEWQARADALNEQTGQPATLGAARNDYGFRAEQEFAFISPDFAPLGVGYSTIESLWQGMVDRVRGFGDTISCGLTAKAREALWGQRLGGVVDHTNYVIGSVAGIVFSIVTGSVAARAAGGFAAGVLRAGVLLQDLIAVATSAYAVRTGTASWLDHVMAAPLTLPLALAEEVLAEPLCFPAGTLVLTEDGNRTIEALRPGDRVWTRNRTGELRTQEVVRTLEHPANVLLRVTCENDGGVQFPLDCTPGQPWLVRGRGWVLAADLHVGDELSTRDDTRVRIAGVDDVAAPCATYNLEVEHDHTYFVRVGADGPAVLVHNAVSAGRLALLRFLSSDVRAGWVRCGERVRHVDRINTRRLIPSNRNGGFAHWYNNVPNPEFQFMWQFRGVRRAVEGRIRHPGGLHEWFPVSRTDRFKDWGIFMEQIQAIRSRTATTHGINPPWRHGGRGSGVAHRQIIDLIDNAQDYPTFLRGLRQWVFHRMHPHDQRVLFEMLNESSYVVRYRP